MKEPKLHAFIIDARPAVDLGEGTWGYAPFALPFERHRTTVYAANPVDLKMRGRTFAQSLGEPPPVDLGHDHDGRPAWLLHYQPADGHRCPPGFRQTITKPAIIATEVAA